MKVLYIFAGEERKGSIQDWLRDLLPPSLQLIMDEIDILSGDSNHDLAVAANRKLCLEKVHTADVVICTPPCSTHSRAVWANSLGPKPIRSRAYPRGFPWLSDAGRRKAELANLLVDFTWEVLRMVDLCSQSRWCLGLSEHPENLGRVGAWGSDSFPASIWDCDEAHSLVADCGWSTLALHQQNFGAPTAKPTRILYNNKVFDNLGHLGWPTFDHGGRYTGPLPKPGP